MNDFLSEADQLWLEAMSRPAEGAEPAAEPVPVRPADVWVLGALAFDGAAGVVRGAWEWFERQEAPVKVMVMYFAAFAAMFAVGAAWMR